MRIGLFTDDFLPRKSGITTSILSLKAGLEELGHQVYVIAPKVRGYEDADSHIVRVASINPLIFDKGRLAVPMPQNVRKILRLDLDVVHSHTNFSIGVLADYVAKKSNAPHITTAHTIWSELIRHYPLQVASSFGFLSMLYQLYFLQHMKIAFPSFPMDRSQLPMIKRQIWYVQNLFFDQADLVTVPSKHMAKIVQDHGMTTRLSIIPNGIDIEFFKEKRTRQFVDSGILRVVSVGRVSPEKRQDILIRSLEGAPNVHLSLIGDGPNTAEFEGLAHSIGVSKRVKFYGSRDQEFIKKIMLDSDVFAQASYRFDSQAIVMIEAQAAGLPVVYCDSALKISTRPESSILIGQKPADFAREFKQLQKAPKTLEELSRAATKTAAKFDHITFAKAMLKEYTKLKSISHI